MRHGFESSQGRGVSSNANEVCHLVQETQAERQNRRTAGAQERRLFSAVMKGEHWLRDGLRLQVLFQACHISKSIFLKVLAV